MAINFFGETRKETKKKKKNKSEEKQYLNGQKKNQVGLGS